MFVDCVYIESKAISGTFIFGTTLGVCTYDLFGYCPFLRLQGEAKHTHTLPSSFKCIKTLKLFKNFINIKKRLPINLHSLTEIYGDKNVAAEAHII